MRSVAEEEEKRDCVRATEEKKTNTTPSFARSFVMEILEIEKRLIGLANISLWGHDRNESY